MKSSQVNPDNRFWLPSDMANSTSPMNDQFTGSALAATLLATLMFFSITLNVIVCVAIVRCIKLRIATSVFIFNLCISGILMTVFSMSIWLGYQIQGGRFFVTMRKVVATSILQWWYMVDIVCGTLGISSLTSISVAKYVAITRPLTYKTIINQRSKSITIVFIWLYAFSVSSIKFVTWSYTVYLLTALCFVLPLSIIIIAYGKIYIIARSHAQVVNVQAGRKKAKEIKAAKTIAIVVGTFCFCWLPFFVVSILMTYTTKVDENLANSIKWLTYVNVFLNPLVYTLVDRRFRTVISRKMVNYFTQNNDQSRSNDSSPKRSVVLSMAARISQYQNTSRGSITVEQLSMTEC